MNLEAGNACGYCNAVVLGEPFPALFNIFQRYWAKSQTEVGGKSAGAVYLREESSAGHLLTSTGGGKRSVSTTLTTRARCMPTDRCWGTFSHMCF